MPPCHPEDLRRHVLWGAYRTANDLLLSRPHAATSTMVTTLADPIETLVTQAWWADKLTDHHAAAIVRFDTEKVAEVVSHLGGHWSEFVAAEFS